MLKTRITHLAPHVRQFILSRYGDGSATVDVRRKTMLGTLCELACERIGYRHKLPKVSECHADSCITLLLPDSLRSHFIHPTKILTVGRLFHDLFNQAFLECLETSCSLGISDYEAVELFMERYGITEDMVSSDTLRKKWRDHQRAMMAKTERMLYGEAPRQQVA